MKYKKTILLVSVSIAIIYFQNILSDRIQSNQIKGMTISCQTWGYEWATPEMKTALVELKGLGINSFSIHPYARILNNGKIKYSNQLEQKHISVPLQWAQEMNLTVMLKPHLAYWGSKFSWRGAINFEEDAEWQRFFDDYKNWILVQATIAEKYKAVIFCIGIEYKNSIRFEKKWRDIIAEVRKVYSGKLTYGANWDTYNQVGFWDALDYIGIQAYFPIVDSSNPTERQLHGGWEKILIELNQFSSEQNKNIIFTELGYNQSEQAAKEPWSSNQSESINAQLTQQRSLKVALERIQNENYIAGVYLWKWLPEIKKFWWKDNYNLQTAENKKLIARMWNKKSDEKLGK